MNGIKWHSLNLIFLHLIFLLLSILLLLALNPAIDSEKVAINKVAINLDNDHHLVANLYTPLYTPQKQTKQNITPPFPVIILCHGINNSKEMMTPLGVELARNGIAAITFDFGGFGESYQLSPELKSIDSLQQSTLKDAQAILAFIRSKPQLFDLTRIGIAGHSMGGDTALNLALLEPNLRSTILLSINGSATPTSPTNLFLGVGVYEQLNPPSELRLMLQQATENDCFATDLKDNICGDFLAGNARKLVISPTSDHVTAPYNPILIKAVINWVQNSFALPVDNLPLVTPWLIFAQLLAFFSALTFTVHLLSKNYLFQAYFQAYFRFIIPLIIALFWLLGANEIIKIITPVNASNIILFLFSLQLCSNFTLVDPEKATLGARVVILYSLLVFLAFFLSAFFCGFPELLLKPHYLFYLPQFLGQWLVFLGYNYAQVIKLTFFPAYTFQLTPSWLFLLLIFLEIIYPGLIFIVIEKVGFWIINWLRQPFTLGIGKLSHQQVSVLFILLVILGFFLSQRLADGLLLEAMNLGFFALKLFFILALLPFLVIVFTLRSPLFRRLETWFLSH